MSELSKWFERKFPYDTSAELHPNVRARLRGTPARLEELVAGLDRETLVASVDGTWSIQRNVGHLLDLEELWASRMEDFDAGAEVLTAADLKNTKTHEADHDGADIADLLGAFREARAALLRTADGLPAEAFARVSRHPRLGQPMRVIDHLFFVAEHDDHHLARIHELRFRLRR